MKLKAIVIGSLLAAGALAAAPAKITVQVDRPGHAISPTLWGIFFEDINLSADGGIYPELVRNRSFEDADQPEYWKFENVSGGRSEAAIDSSRPLNPFNRRSLRIKLDGQARLSNAGYWGMNIVKGDSYTLKLAARAEDGFNGPLNVKLLSGGREIATGEIRGIAGEWKYYTVKLRAQDTDSKAMLELTCDGRGTLFLDMVSLLPDKTWKNHGLRPDLAESLDDLHPSFVRFPGGCWVEGDDMAHMYHWKNTIGDIDVRTPLWNIWGYYATHGLGFHEYLQMAEDLGATPLFDINVGMSHREVIPMDRMGQWVQDALDAIEYANGPTNTVWGGLRARNGHPAPFNLQYMEIGNENGGAAYHERWPLFVKAIKDKHPEMKLVANHWQGGYPTTPKPDLVDEHYYNTPEFFMQQAHRYDDYDRKGPKVFVGEYAVTRNGGKGNLRAAIGEAAFMTGIERNSDIVSMACYAPLFVNINHRQWNPDLINFDSSRWYGLPSYYVQKLFSQYRGTVTLPTDVEAATAQEPLPTGCIGVGTWNTAAEFKDVKVTAPDGKVLFASDFTKNADGWKMLGGGAWTVADGALRQTAESEFIRALAGDKSWTDYTLELKARKISGREGFLILFHINDDEDRVWWNIGGWDNTQNALELDETVDGKRGHIETGRWYDIKVEVRGTSVKCSLDGRVIHDVKNPRQTTRGLFASSTRDERTGEIIVKVVNASSAPTETQIQLDGTRNLTGNAEAIVLTDADPKAENSLDEPQRVAPKTEPLSITGNTFTRVFPGNSLTVLRLPAAK
ncbi:MAG TPA: alpha-L-arabinofuranosidase C-terminal domain-containing protein [Verrucomicrobiae bacterium]|nr:alpha-L-arabinofuranosidase C-terminal domain-containing protein [Verrucomicrobiae bacterium]